MYGMPEMSITVKFPEVEPIPAYDMLVGEIGQVVNPEEYKGEIVLRVYDGLVSLKDPNHTWMNVQTRKGSINNKNALLVYRYPKGTLVTITAK